jgi:hypothetical protein
MQMTALVFGLQETYSPLQTLGAFASGGFLYGAFRGGAALWTRFRTTPRPRLAPEVLPPLREAYIREVEALKATAEQMRAAGKTPEEIARTLHQMRRNIGIKYKELTPPEMLEQIYQRNLEKYGDKLGPTIDYFRSRGKTWEEIIESACRTGGADLGLAKPQ